MGKQNYRESIEKDRQEISVDSTGAPSRRAQRKAVKKEPKKRKNILLPVLFFMFILIPVTILIYVAVFYEPNDTLITKTESNTVSVEQNPIDPETALVPAEDGDEEAAAAEEAEKKAQQEAAEKEAAEKAAKEEAAAKEAAAKEQAQKEAAAAEAKAKADAQAAEAKREQERAAAKKEAEKKANTPAPSSKTHVVQPGETLYRIAVNNYGTGEAVDKIKAANGLSSNELTVGQTLVLP